MKKIITSLLLVITSHVLFGQYFGERTTYFVRCGFEPTTQYSGKLEQLDLIQQTSLKEKYTFQSDTISVSNDSIFGWFKRSPANSRSKILLFVNGKLEGDSFESVIPFGDNGLVCNFTIDSIKMNNQRKHTYFHLSSSSEEIWFPNFIWVDSVGEIVNGLNYLEISYSRQLDYNEEYLSFCRNDIIQKMDGSPWENTGDTDCSFAASLKQLSIAANQAPKSLFTVYPNPSSTIVTIQNFSATASYRIISSVGQVCDIDLDASSIDISNLEKGLYFIVVLDGDVSTRARFIKE